MLGVRLPPCRHEEDRLPRGDLHHRGEGLLLALGGAEPLAAAAGDLAAVAAGRRRALRRAGPKSSSPSAACGRAGLPARGRAFPARRPSRPARRRTRPPAGPRLPSERPGHTRRTRCSSPNRRGRRGARRPRRARSRGGACRGGAWGRRRDPPARRSRRERRMRGARRSRRRQDPRARRRWLEAARSPAAERSCRRGGAGARTRGEDGASREPSADQGSATRSTRFVLPTLHFCLS